MATNQTMKYCKACKSKTMHVQPSTSHILHLLLSIITSGIWIVIWIIIAMNNSSKAQCTQCGKDKGVFG